MSAGTDARVVALCGSMRETSHTRTVLQEVLAGSRDAGGTTEAVDLRTYDLPALYAAEPQETDASQLEEVVETADSVVLGTPNYHGSYSGALKNALDYCGRDQFDGTTVGLVEVAGGGVPGTALVHLRSVARTLHAWTLPTELAVPNSRSTISPDGIDDVDLAERARELGRQLVAYAGVERYPDVSESADRATVADGREEG